MTQPTIDDQIAYLISDDGDVDIRMDMHGAILASLRELRESHKDAEDARRYRDALIYIAEHYTDTGLAAKHMSAHARMILSPTGNSIDYVSSKAIDAARGDSREPERKAD